MSFLEILKFSYCFFFLDLTFDQLSTHQCSIDLLKVLKLSPKTALTHMVAPPMEAPLMEAPPMEALPMATPPMATLPMAAPPMVAPPRPAPTAPPPPAPTDPRRHPGISHISID